MTLSETEIRDELRNGELEINRPGQGEVSIEPSSVDLHLAPVYGYYEDQDEPVLVDDQSTYPDYTEVHTTGKIAIDPGEFLLCHTEEVVSLPPGVVGVLEGRSSVGRLGQFVENAGLVDAGFHGDLTLEMYNASKNTIALEPGMRIVQLTLYEHGEDPDVPYSAHNNKYQGQRGPTPSRLHEDF